MCSKVARGPDDEARVEGQLTSDEVHRVWRGLPTSNREVDSFGSDIHGALLDASATEIIGRPLGLTGHDLSAALDPWQIVVSRTTLGGAAPDEVSRMAGQAAAQADDLAAEARRWREAYQAAEDALVAAARRGAAGQDPGFWLNGA